MSKKNNTHYVDNKKFLEELKKWKDKCQEAEEAGDERPQITNYIGECFLKIANGLSYKPNFINYTYKDEMVSDGIENCLQYASNFNPEKSKNPFAYFTQIIYYAFLRRIQKEKKQTHVKNKIVEKTDHQSWTTMTYDDRSYHIPYTFAMDNLPDEDVYKPKNKKTDEKKKAGLERFMDEGETDAVRGYD